MREFKCPHCGSENIQKCEVIYMSGTVSHTSTTTFGKYEATTEGQAATDLAQAVAPPAKMETSWVAGLIFGGLAYLFGIDSFLAGLVLGAIALVFFKGSIDAEKYNNEIYPKEYERWRNTYICHRCGNQFLLK